MAEHYELNPPPLESYDPALAEFIRQVATKTHPTIRGFNVSSYGPWGLWMNDGTFKHFKKKEPNAPCFCGSGKKYKKCCGKP